MPHFPKKLALFSSTIRHFWALYQYSTTQKILFRLLTGLKINLQVTPISAKTFGKFQGLSHLPRKMVLYQSKNWCFWLIFNQSGYFWRTSKQVFRYLKYWKNVFWKFPTLLIFAKKNSFAFVEKKNEFTCGVFYQY